MLNQTKKLMPILLVLVLLAVSAVPAMAMKPERTTIVDVALAVNADSGEFSILIAALQAADEAVIKTLDGNGQFTVFAPTDAAFVALLGELGLTAEQLLGEKDLVTQVLLYHVAHGRRYAADVLDSDRIRTLQGGFLFQDGGVLTDQNERTSTIIAPDAAEADNGIIHIIDTVVLP
jgi:transforming growth factor-beta-induced protein